MNNYLVGQKLRKAVEVETAIPLPNIRSAIRLTFAVDRITSRGGKAQIQRAIDQTLAQELK